MSIPANIAVLNLVGGNNYSTDEQVVGTWIDGKPLYQKYFHIGALSNAGSSWIDTLVDIGASIDTIVYIDGIIASADWVYKSLYIVGSTNVVPTVRVSQNKCGISYYGNLAHIIDSFVIIKYTKTTD